jgi:hypothetical protein
MKAAIRSRLPTEKMLSEVDVIWAEEEQAVADAWETDWQAIAPGAELLAAVWRAHRGSYEKARDGVLIAAAMSEAPAELRNAIEAMRD